MATKEGIRAEEIFAYAAGLDQSGRMRNSILCKEREIFILNYDRTILMGCGLKNTDPEFSGEFIFEANDYDSMLFTTEGGNVVFKKVVDGYIRKKRCGASKTLDYETISTLYYRYSRKKTTSRFVLRKAIMGLLQDDLSHVEIHNDNGELKVVQRDIFSGTVIEITEEKTGLDIFDAAVLEPFDPIGLRTVDLDVLLNYDEQLTFSFVPGLNYFIVEGAVKGFKAILSWCLYDQLGKFNAIGG